MPGRTWLAAREYWEKKGKKILSHVKLLPQTNITEDEIFNILSKKLDTSNGIGIDEVNLGRWDRNQGKIFVNVLRKIRKRYPNKIIAVWCAGSWNKDNAYILVAIRDYADMYLPEIYISQSYARKHGLSRFRNRVMNDEAIAPGITKKMIIGLGMYPAMADDLSENFIDHLSDQIKLLGTDPTFKDILGIALYSPRKYSSDVQKKIDNIIKDYFNL